MKRNLKDVFWTARTIRDKWKEEQKEAGDFTKAFIKILTDIGFSNQNHENPRVEWFMSETEVEKKGILIFSKESKFNDPAMNAPTMIEELLCLFKKTKGIISIDEGERVAICLSELLPVVRSVAAYDKIQEDMANRKENQDIDAWEDYKERKKKIVQLVDKYSYSQLQYFLEERIFVDIDGKTIQRKEVRRAFYQEQYRLIKAWAEKWSAIMSNAKTVWIAERFTSGYEICRKEKIGEEERKEFYINGEIKNEMLGSLYDKPDWLTVSGLCDCLLEKYNEEKKEGKCKDSLGHKEESEKTDFGEKEQCRDGCRIQYEKIVSHTLKETSKDDFDYMLLKAIYELEEIHDKILIGEYSQYYHNEFKDRDEADLWLLFEVRKRMLNRKRNMVF